MVQSTLGRLPSPPARPRWRRLFQGLAALGLAATGIAASAIGCSTPAFCPGGFVRTVNGAQTCEGLCSPYGSGASNACQDPGNVCVNNFCALQCSSKLDCAAGEDCVPATTDGASGAATTVCQPSSKAAIGAPCPGGGECGGIMACPDGSNCDYSQCGGDTCSPDPVACAGDPKCTRGKCADGSACVVQGCTQDQCKPLVCLSGGAGDAAAYCTMQDCHADSDCGTGFWCGQVRDGHPICGAPAAKLPGLCGVSCSSNVACTNAYGAGATCKIGSSGSGYCEGACVMAGADGATYAAGPFCTMRSECKARGVCDPCTTDLDCSSTPGRHCTAMPMGGDKFCTADCNADSDCANGFQCVATSGGTPAPSGKACVPRYGSCKTSAPAQFCEPCHVDSDCATGLYCTRQESGVERTCTLPIGSMACTKDADCPASPSGVHGVCADGRIQSSPGDGIYHTCYLPFFVSVDRFQCWPQNSGAACGTNGDCLSKMCKGADASTGQLGLCQ